MRLTDCGVMGRGPRVGGLCAGGVGAKQAGSEDRRAQMAAWGTEAGPESRAYGGVGGGAAVTAVEVAGISWGC